MLNLSSNRLKYLPFSISKLKELQALWLSENQTKSIIPLQNEKDNRGRRYLTCYLFPQEQQQQDPRKTQLNRIARDINRNYNDFYNQSLEEQESWNEENDPREHLIRFSAQDNSNIVHKPYPKETKNHEYQLRNKAIYENNITQMIMNNNQLNIDSQESSSGEDIMPKYNDLLYNKENLGIKEDRVKFSSNIESPRRLLNYDQTSNRSPNLSKLNHQKLITKIHMDRVQDLFNSPTRVKSETRPVHDLIYGGSTSSADEFVNTKKQPISILKPQTNKYVSNQDYESDFEVLPTPQKTPVFENNSIHPLPIFKAKPINLDSIKSPLLQTALTDSNKTLQVPTSSPLKVNITETKWIGNSKMFLQNDGPSSQVSSDSGYSGQTIINLNNLAKNESDIEEKCSYLNVTIVKSNGLGFSIAGGKDSIGNPFKYNDPGIFVTKVQQNGPADNILLPGDQIIKVNGEDFTLIEHDKAVSILKSCNKHANILIKRC